jgi:hypothetical protein
MVRLKAPRGHSSVGFAGAEFEIRDGEVEVPDEAEAALKPHGYKRAAAAGVSSVAAAARPSKRE